MLQSASVIFYSFKKALKRAQDLGNVSIICSLGRAFKEHVSYYLNILTNKMNAVAAVDDDQTITCLCLLVNTYEYCNETIGQLERTLRKMLLERMKKSANDELPEDKQVSYSSESDALTTAAGEAVNMLITLIVDVRLAPAFTNMSSIQWSKIESTGDSTPYINEMVRPVLAHDVPKVKFWLSKMYFKYFCDHFAASVSSKFVNTIFKLRKVSDSGARQLMVDVYGLKTLLLAVPTVPADPGNGSGPVGEQSDAPESYTRNITRELGHTADMLRVVAAATTVVAETYCSVFPDGNKTELIKIIELKGLKKSEQQNIIDQYDKLNPAAQGPPSDVSSTSGVRKLLSKIKM